MLPRSFLDRMQRMLGEEYEAFLASYEQERYQALRLNTLKPGISGQALAGFLHLSGVPWAEDCYYYEAEDQPGKHPYHAAGVYYIQEPSAMAPAGLLDVQPGERVLDLCAAPGGKSSQIAAKLDGEGFLLCNEVHAARAKILSGNVERMGIVNAYVANETPARLAEVFPEYFDKVLVDAPCSGEGMFRKNEAACEEWSLENVSVCARRQDEILDCAAGMLRPGGKLVYSTCTFAPEENEGSVSRFLERHGDFDLLPIDKGKMGLKDCDGSAEYPEVSAAQAADAAKDSASGQAAGVVKDPASERAAGAAKDPASERAAGAAKDPASERAADDAKHTHLEYTLRLWPHKVKGEGHFAALLQKAGKLPEGYHNSSANGFVTGVSDRELDAYHLFCQETFGTKELPFRHDCHSVFIRFGDQIYLVSSQMPSVKGLKVLRPGLHVGTLKKNRFEPSHALALALSPEKVRNVWNLDASGDTAAAYLNGQTFPAGGEKGWYLICLDGFGAGWGKLAGGIMKNHYPKGLRLF